MTPIRSTHGFGLIELIVALALTSVVVIAVFTTFFGSQRATTRVTSIVENRQNARAAVQLLERDIRMAGSGWGRDTVQGAFNNAPLQVFALTTGYGGTTASNDTIGIVGAWDLITTLTTPMALSTSNIRVASSTGFKTGDFIMVSSDVVTRRHMFQVTSVSGNDLLHATSSPYNGPGGHANFPTGAGYPVGTQVFRVAWVSYRVDSTRGRAVLMRRENGRPDQVVAYDVGQFQIRYALQGGGQTRSPASLTIVDQVVPVVSTVTVSQGQSIADSSTASIRPRTF